MIFIMGDPSGAKIRIAAEYGSSREAPALPAKMKTYEKLAAHTNSGGKMVHSIRSMGSAALNICYVATGGIDIYWEIGVSATWLYAAQALTTVLALGCLRECRCPFRTPCHNTARVQRRHSSPETTWLMSLEEVGMPHICFTSMRSTENGGTLSLHHYYDGPARTLICV